MTRAEKGRREELGRIRRVADQSCSGHAIVRDRLAARATFLDLLILGLSTWLVAVAFVDPMLSASLTPPGLSDRLWLGLLGTATFFLTVVQLKVDWKSRAEAHRRTFELYAETKREIGYVLAHEVAVDDVTYERLTSRYNLATAAGVAIPEKQFVALKRAHKIKVAISKILDEHPSASPTLTMIQLWIRDNRRR